MTDDDNFLQRRKVQPVVKTRKAVFPGILNNYAVSAAMRRLFWKNIFAATAVQAVQTFFQLR